MKKKNKNKKIEKVMTIVIMDREWRVNESYRCVRKEERIGDGKGEGKWKEKQETNKTNKSSQRIRIGNKGDTWMKKGEKWEQIIRQNEGN